MDTMKALVLKNKGEIQVQDVPRPRPKKGEALIRVKVCGVCGSDISRIFGNIAYYYPSIPGHEFAGEIVEIGNEEKDAIWLGKRVTVFPLLPCHRCRYCQAGYYEICENYGYIGSRQDGAFAEFVIAPIENCLELPDAVSYECGAMSEPAAVTLHALRRASIPFGKTVAVFGLGPIGVLFGMWAKISGATQLIGFDIDPQKFQFARDVKFDDAVVPSEENIPHALEQYTECYGFDLTCEASGSNQALVDVLKVTHKFGQVILLGNQEKEVKLNPKEMNLILRKQLTLYGTWNSRFVQMGSDWKAVLEFERTGEADLRSFISHRISLEEAPDFLRLMKDRQIQYNKVLIAP